MTQDWVVPAKSRPPLLSELVERIDEALARARSSEAAAVSIGAAALDAADQARRAADLVERATRTMFDDAGPAALPQAVASGSGDAAEAPVAGVAGEDVLDRFSVRADRVMARLQALERVPAYA